TAYSMIHNIVCLLPQVFAGTSMPLVACKSATWTRRARSRMDARTSDRGASRGTQVDLELRSRGSRGWAARRARWAEPRGAEASMSTASSHSSPADTGSGHARWVRVTHWIVAASVLALAVTGFTILMAHPRLYWGAVGNDLTPALIELPISRNYRHGGWEVGTPSFPDG